MATYSITFYKIMQIYDIIYNRGETMYTKEEQAIKFVIKALEGKKRIKEDIDLSFHSISVGVMLKNNNCDENTVTAGFLHDIIEDSDYDYEYIKENFGDVVADYVLNVSEDLSITDWKQRKIAFIENLEKCNSNIILIEVADKLHNLLSDYELWKKEGRQALATLNTTYDMNKWYYLEMKKLFNSKIKNSNLLDRYNQICDMYFSD